MLTKWTALAGTTAALWALAAGCGPSIGAYCGEVCDCTGCSDAERDECVDALDDSRHFSEEAGCGSEWNDYLSCASSELECTDDHVQVDGCDAEAEKLAKCGGGGIGSPESLCGAVCDCVGCSDAELDDCIDSISDSQQSAEDVGCSQEYAEYLQCVSANVTCVDGQVDTPSCVDESSSFLQCVQ